MCRLLCCVLADSPKNASELGKKLHRLQPQLKAIGIIAETKRVNGSSQWILQMKNF